MRLWRIDVLNNDKKGMYLTLFNMFQCGVLFVQKHGNSSIDFSVSIWKMGIHVHCVTAEENRCREIE